MLFLWMVSRSKWPAFSRTRRSYNMLWLNQLWLGSITTIHLSSLSLNRGRSYNIERIEDVVGMACGKRTIVIDIRRLLYLLPLGSLHMLYSTYFRSSYKLEPKQNILSQGRTIHMIGCSFLKPRYNILCLVIQDHYAEEKTERNFFTSPAYV